MTSVEADRDTVEHVPTGQEDALWALVRDVGLLVGGDGRVVSVAPSVEATYGHRPEALVERPLIDVVHPDGRVMVEAYLSRPDLADPDVPCRLPVAHADGSWVPTLARLRRWERPEGADGVKVMLRPVEGSVDGMLAQERAASERLQLVDEMKHRLLEAVSHELRSPLTIIGGFAETLQRDGVDFSPERLQQVGASIGRQAVRLQRIVSDLMDLDRMSRGVLLARGEKTDLASAVIEIVEQVPLGPRQLNLEVDRVAAVVDRAKFARIVESLLVNARRHTPADTAVWVRLQASDGGALLEVADDGPGLPDDVKARVFSPFAQGRLLDPSSSGLGLGLALVHRFAQLHGGRAWVEDRDGGGARFFVWLPADGSPAMDLDDLNSKLEQGRAYERAAFDGPAAAAVQLRPEALGVVNSVLRTVRRELGMTVAYLSAFTDTEQVVLAVDGDGESVGVHPGGSFPVEDTYCVRMIRGQVGNLIVDTSAEPVVANLPSTEAGLACYAGVPVRLPNGQLFGTLCCADREPRKDLTPSQVTVLRTAAGLIGDHVGHGQLLAADIRELTRRIEQVLSRPDSLQTVYQPIVDVADGQVSGVEALTRFPDSDLRPPDVWFADAERVGLANQLEQVTIMRALRGLELLPDGCYLSVNLSPATVISGGLRPLLGRVRAERIVIEITEHAAVGDYEALSACLHPFRRAGIRLAIDDVGSGFASLRHVLRLSPDIIKIDRSLVHEVISDPTQQAIAIALADLGRRVGTKIVAEGIEDPSTLDVLRDAGITHAQGWLFDRPGPLPLKRTSYTLNHTRRGSRGSANTGGRGCTLGPDRREGPMGKSYTEEFRRQAVELYRLGEDVTYAQVAEEMAVRRVGALLGSYADVGIRPITPTSGLCRPEVEEPVVAPLGGRLPDVRSA